jgi:hypothetical protein
MWGKVDHAYRALRAAERAALEELSARASAHRLVTTLAHTATGPLKNEIRALAERIGAPL